MSRLWIERDGERLTLDGWLDADAWSALAGTTGTGFPGGEGRWFDGAGDGRTFRGIRHGGRTVTIPLLVQGADRGDVMGHLSRLGAMLRPSGPVLARLVVEAADGTVWWTPVVRQQPADWAWWSDEGRSAGGVWLRTGVVLDSPSPWWTAEAAVEHAIVAGGAGRGLIGTGRSLAKLMLSQSQAFGDVTIENPGDAPASLRVLVTGPGTDIVLGRGDQEVEWGGSLSGGESLVFDFDAATVVDHTGANRYGDIATGKARFWQLPPGTSTVDVSMSGASSGSEIRLQWFPRRQAIL